MLSFSLAALLQAHSPALSELARHALWHSVAAQYLEYVVQRAAPVFFPAWRMCAGGAVTIGLVVLAVWLPAQLQLHQVAVAEHETVSDLEQMVQEIEVLTEDVGELPHAMASFAAAP